MAPGTRATGPHAWSLLEGELLARPAERLGRTGAAFLRVWLLYCQESAVSSAAYARLPLGHIVGFVFVWCAADQCLLHMLTDD